MRGTPAPSETSTIWRAAYEDILERLDMVAANARLTLCGLSACVDATISLHDAGPLLAATDPPEAVRFANTLLQRASAGIGGEIRVDWPSGPAWLDRQLAFRLELGGTGPHAARMLTALGAPALLALEIRSPEQLSVLDPQIPLARQGQAVPARSIDADHSNATRIYIFEYTKDRPLGLVTPPRSSRIIVRFDDPGLEDDRAFRALSFRLAPTAGAALLSGFNSVANNDLAAALLDARELAGAWRVAGIATIHLELAGYTQPEYRDRVLAELAGTITSLGLSGSEFEALMPRAELASGMCELGERLALRRVCVHADGWAATATLDDPQRERDALLMGSLLASARAAYGRPTKPSAIPADAVFEAPPALRTTIGAWQIVVCATPYIAQPAVTVGLGDTFTAGCLLVLGQDRTTNALAVSSELNTVP